jgi:iron complex transport system substrate-binding protein
MPRTSRRVTVHSLTLREVEVVRVVDLTPGMRRITLGDGQLRVRDGAGTATTTLLRGLPEPDSFAARRTPSDRAPRSTNSYLQAPTAPSPPEEQKKSPSMTMTSLLRRRGAALAGATLSAALVLTGCGSSSDAPGDTTGAMRSFEADNGTIEIPADPQRIVAIGSAPIYLSLGVEPVGLGPKATESELAWLPPEAKQVNDAAVDVGDEVDYEKVASLEPDLIVIYDPAHVWEGGKYNEERFQSIAPTIYIELSNTNWKAQTERLANAVGEVGTFEDGKARYDTLVTEINSEYSELLTSTTFMVLNRWGGKFTPEAGVLNMEYPGSYCTTYAEDAGLEIVPEAPADGDISVELSIEQLSDTVADADVIIYPLGADGAVTPEFAPVLETNIWQSIPQTNEGRALGVQCDRTSTYSSKIVNLESLKEALGTLPAAG